LGRICDVLQNLHAAQRKNGEPQNHQVNTQFQPYDANNESMDNFIDRLENHFERKQIVGDGDKVGIFLELIPPAIFQMLTNLCVPEKPKTKTYKDLVDMLKTTINPKPNVFAQQHRFAMRIQNDGESLVKFM
jgi:hypothetical protein